MSAPSSASWLRGGLPPSATFPTGPVVVKFGGSLLGRADWPELARALIDGVGPDAPRTLVVGGGPVVEGLREIDRTRKGDDPLLHRLAIDGMGIVARLVAATLGLPLVARPLARRVGAVGIVEPTAAVLDVATWIEAAPDGLGGLPASWQVTSDSIAARVAARHRLGLILAKSALPTAATLEALAAAGWVDGCFPGAAADVPSLGWMVPAG